MQNFTNQYICGDASLESPLIRLLLTPNEAGIKVLFHGGRLGLNVCLVFFVYSFVFGVITYGIMAPTGEQQRKHSRDQPHSLTPHLPCIQPQVYSFRASWPALPSAALSASGWDRPLANPRLVSML